MFVVNNVMAAKALREIVPTTPDESLNTIVHILEQVFEETEKIEHYGKDNQIAVDTKNGLEVIPHWLFNSKMELAADTHAEVRTGLLHIIGSVFKRSVSIPLMREGKLC